MRKAAAEAIAEVHRIESKFSRYLEGSVVSRINRNAGLDLIEVDPETKGLLDFADQLWALSGGLFDITSGVLRRAWDFKKALVPKVDELQTLLNLVDWKRVERHGNKVRLSTPGMQLDFGGFHAVTSLSWPMISKIRSRSVSTKIVSGPSGATPT